METEAIKRFLNKRIRLEFHSGFVLRGTIDEVYKETILFRTEQAESLINVTEIKNIKEEHGGF